MLFIERLERCFKETPKNIPVVAKAYCSMASRKKHGKKQTGLCPSKMQGCACKWGHKLRFQNFSLKLEFWSSFLSKELKVEMPSWKRQHMMLSRSLAWRAWWTDLAVDKQCHYMFSLFQIGGVDLEYTWKRSWYCNQSACNPLSPSIRNKGWRWSFLSPLGLVKPLFCLRIFSA